LKLIKPTLHNGHFLRQFDYTQIGSFVSLILQVVGNSFTCIARLRRHTFFSLPALNRLIAELLQGLNDRPFQKNQTESRRSLLQRAVPAGTHAGGCAA
jgi:hypothetical protein